MGMEEKKKKKNEVTEKKGELTIQTAGWREGRKSSKGASMKNVRSEFVGCVRGGKPAAKQSGNGKLKRCWKSQTGHHGPREKESVEKVWRDQGDSAGKEYSRQMKESLTGGSRGKPGFKNVPRKKNREHSNKHGPSAK